jgi:hypothetical protein
MPLGKSLVLPPSEILLPLLVDSLVLSLGGNLFLPAGESLLLPLVDSLVLLAGESIFLTPFESLPSSPICIVALALNPKPCGYIN